MNFKRLFFYLLLNIIVSATTVLIVLNLWERANRVETVIPEPVSLLPTVIASAIPPTNAPSPEPTLALRPYQVEEGETLGEIALQFGISQGGTEKLVANDPGGSLSTVRHIDVD